MFNMQNVTVEECQLWILMQLDLWEKYSFFLREVLQKIVALNPIVGEQ